MFSNRSITVKLIFRTIQPNCQISIRRDWLPGAARRHNSGQHLGVNDHTDVIFSHQQRFLSDTTPMSDSAHGGRLPAATQAPVNQGQIPISGTGFLSTNACFQYDHVAHDKLGIGLLQAPLP